MTGAVFTLQRRSEMPWPAAMGVRSCPVRDPATDSGRVLASRLWRAQSWAVDGILKSVALTVKSSIAAASKMASSSTGWHRHAVPWPDPADLGVVELFTVQIDSHELLSCIRFHLGASLPSRTRIGHSQASRWEAPLGAGGGPAPSSHQRGSDLRWEWWPGAGSNRRPSDFQAETVIFSPPRPASRAASIRSLP